MSFATEALKPTSDRFMLIQIQPKKRVTGATSLGGGLYQFSLSNDYIVDSVQGNGGNLSFTHSNGLLVVTSPSLNLTSGSVYTIVYLNMFLTGTTARVSSGVSGVPNAEWLPYILKYPTANQSMKNISEGVLSYSSSSIKIITTDNSIQKLLDLNNSFSNARVKIWECINSIDNNMVVFEGVAGGISLQDGVAVVSVLDTFSLLNKTATYLPEYTKSYIANSTTLTTYPDISTPDQAAPIVFGASSPYRAKETASPFTFGAPFARTYHVTDGLRLIKHTPQVPQQSTTNAKYFVARFIGSGVKAMSFGTITRAYREFTSGASVGGYLTYSVYYYIQCTNFSGKIGDSFVVTGTAIADRVYVCNDQNVTGPDGATYNFVCISPRSLFVSSSLPASSGLVSLNPISGTNLSYCVYRNDLSSLSFETDSGSTQTKDAFYYLNQFNTDAVTVETVSLGTYYGLPVSALYINVDYSSSGLNAFFRFNELDPSNFYCRFTSDIPVITHGEMMKFLCDAAGLTTNESTFDQADADLNASVSVTFPLNNEQQFKRYLDDAQYILKSTFGVLRLNEDREVEYKIIKNPSAIAPDRVRDNTNIIAGSFSTSVQYQDIASTVRFKNPQLQDIRSANQTGPGYVVTNPEAQYLHGIVNEKNYDHCLNDIATRKDAIAGYIGSPTVEYTSSSASEDLVTRIGDVVDVTHKSVATEDNQAKGFVVELNTGTSQSTIRINEIRGVP